MRTYIVSPPGPLFSARNDLGYIENDVVYNRCDEEMGRVDTHISFFSPTTGTIYGKTSYGTEKIGTLDGKYWYDLKGRPVAEIHSSRIEFMKTPYTDSFIRMMFG